MHARTHTHTRTYTAQALEQVGVIIHRDTWLGYAEQAERSGYPATCRCGCEGGCRGVGVGVGV